MEVDAQPPPLQVQSEQASSDAPQPREAASDAPSELSEEDAGEEKEGDDDDEEDAGDVVIVHDDQEDGDAADQGTFRLVRDPLWRTMGSGLGRSSLNVHARRFAKSDYILVNHSQSVGTMGLGAVTGIISGGADRFGDLEVFVNAKEMAYVQSVCRSDELIRAAMQLLIDNVVGGGLSVTMDYWGSCIALNDMMQRMFDIEWVQRFLRDLLWSLFMYGFVVVRLVRSSVMPSEAVPQVIDPKLYELSVVQSFDKAKEYRVYPLRYNPTADGGAEATRQGMKRTVTKKRAKDGSEVSEVNDEAVKRPAKAIYEGDESVAVYVYPGNEPGTEGELSSPLKTIVDKLRTLDGLFADNAAASYWAARPPYPINSLPERNSAKDYDPMATYNPPEAVVGLHQEKLERKKTDADGDRVAAAVREAIDMVQFNAEVDDKAGTTGRYGANPHAMAPPMRNYFLPGLSHAVGSGPQPAFNPALPELYHIVSNLVAGVLKIPAQMINPGQQVHAANAELNMRLWDIAISCVQKVVEPIMADLFAVAYGGTVKDFAMRYSKETVDKWAESGTKKEHDSAKGPVDGPEHLEDAVRKHIKSTGAATNATIDTEEASRAKMRRQMTPKAEKNARKLGTREISQKNVRTLIQEHITFNITFKRTPMLLFENVYQLYELNIIDWDQLTKMAIEIFHIDPSHVLTKEQRDAQEKEKRKFEFEMNEAYGPPEEEGAGGGAAKKKPAAGGASSSSGSKRKAEGGGGASKSKATAQSGASKKKKDAEKSKSGGGEKSKALTAGK